MVFRHAPIPRKGSGKQQQQQQYLIHEILSLLKAFETERSKGNREIHGREYVHVW